MTKTVTFIYLLRSNLPMPPKTDADPQEADPFIGTRSRCDEDTTSGRSAGQHETNHVGSSRLRRALSSSQPLAPSQAPCAGSRRLLPWLFFASFTLLTCRFLTSRGNLDVERDGRKGEKKKSSDAEAVRGKYQAFGTRIWPSLRERMCPNSVPNVEPLGEALFDMAWDELFPDGGEGNRTGGRRRKNGTPPLPGTVGTFYSGDYWGAISYRERNRPAVVYIVVWKSASNFIHGRIHGLADSQPAAKFTKNLEIEDVVELLPDACFVTAVRDPIAHFISAYNEIEYRNLNWYDDWTAGHGDNETWYGRYPKATEGRFTRFIADLLEERTEKKMTYHPSDMWHVYPQSRILKRLADLDVFAGNGNPDNSTQNGLLHILNTTSGIESKLVGFLHRSCPESFSDHSADAAESREKEKNGTKENLPGQHESSLDKAGFYGTSML